MEENTEKVIKIVAVGTNQYGDKAVLDAPYEAKEDIKELEWDLTHRSFSIVRKEGRAKECWNVDFDALEETITSLSEKGYTIGVHEDVKTEYLEKFGTELTIPDGGGE